MGGPAGAVTSMNALGLHRLVPTLAVSRALPWVELGLALWLLSGLRVRWASVCVTLLLVGFSLFLFALGAKIGWSKRCGCLGPLDPVSIRISLVRNGLLIALTVIGLALASNRSADAAGLLPVT
jgi:hypothetical protein